MRIFWLFNHPAPYKVQLFNRLGKNHDLTVFFERSTEGGRNKTFYAHGNLSFHAVYDHPLILGGVNNYSRKVLQYLKKAEDYDVIILNGWRTFTERIAISYCKKHHIPYIFYINGGIPKPKENNFIHLLKRHYISGATAYLAPDPRSKEYLLHYGAEESKISLFPYGSVAEEEILPAPYDEKGVTKLRTKLGIEGKRVFVTAGFFIKRKNFARLIEIWADMPEDHTLYLIGEGKQKALYEKTIARLNLHNVFIRDYMDHASLFRFYRACDAFVFPSNEDIYGHVVTEAMSQGLPVFSAKNVNAARALITPRETGELLDFDNSEEVVLSLTTSDVHAMKVASIERSKGFTFEESAHAHIKIFEQYLTEKEAV